VAGTEAYLVPSFMVIRPAVWPQYTKSQTGQTDNTDRQDNGVIANRGHPKMIRSEY